MGVDCKILIPWRLVWEKWEGDAYIASILELPRHREAFAALSGMLGKPLPAELSEGQLRYDDEANTYHEHPVTEDRYGAPLRVYEARLVADTLRPYMTEPWAHGLRAAVAYLDAMPPTAPAILFWH